MSESGSESVSKDIVKERLKALQAEYAAKLPVRIREIEQDWKALKQAWQADTLQQLLRKTHILMGSAASFDFVQLSVKVRELDELLQQLRQRNTTPDSSELARIDDLVRAAKSSAKRPDSEASNELVAMYPAPADTGKKQLFVVEDDKEFADYLALQLQQHGYDVRVFNQTSGLYEAVEETPPALLIMDIMLTERGLAGPQAMFNIQKGRSKPLPVIFMSARTDMAARLAAVRAGADAYFAKPIDMTALLEKLYQLTNFRDQDAYRVLIIDDAGRYAPKCAETLRQANFQVRILSDPVLSIEALNDFSPMLVLINSQLSGLSGLELAVVIRQQERFSRLPIIFFADSFDHALRRAAAKGICEDFVNESVSPELLVATVANRIANTEELRKASSRDPLTGLYNRQWLVVRLTLEKRSADAPYPLAVLYISLDNYREIDKVLGLAAGDAVIVTVGRLLNKQLVKRDVLVRFGDCTFVILSFHRSLEEVQALAESIRAKLKELVIEVGGRQALTTCSIGIGLFNKATSSPELALLNAAAACADAFRHGGNRIQLHDSAQAIKLDRDRQNYWQQTIAAAVSSEDRFFLVYQPIAPLHGKPNQYFDVLLRMKDEQAGIDIAASEFIDIAKQSNLILRIDRWVIKQAIDVAAQKYHGGAAVDLFLPIADASLADAALVSWIEDCLAKARLPGKHIAFIISKTAASTQFKVIWRFVSQVKASGCRLVLRDFDNDPNGFQLLTLLGVDFVKIQTDLIRNIPAKTDVIDSVKAIVSKVHNENIAVIAPFVEEPKSLSLLWNVGIDYIEGHFVQAPSDSLDYDFTDMVL